MEKLLQKLEIINPATVYEYADSVRDDENLSVYKCRSSGVIFLKEKTRSEDYYKQKSVSKDLNHLLINEKGGGALLPANCDDERRASQFRPLIKGKAWLDFGCGTGNLIDLLKDAAELAHACELNNYYVQEMRKRNITVYTEFTEEHYHSYDVITLFHVLEHLHNPLDILTLIFKLLKKGGILIMEIPHANDFLLKTLDLECFKKFTFFSEHLVLHTRNSLEVLLQHTLFNNILIKGYQRYSLDNHLYWLRYGKLGGHASFLRDIMRDDLKKSYEEFLISIDQTDTLIAFAYK